MPHLRLRMRRAGAIAVVLLAPALAHAEDCEKPTSAGDIVGNLKSFGCNLGKDVKVRQPYEAAPKIVAVGMLPGLPAPPRGYDYNAVCFEGEKLPQAMQPDWYDGRSGVVGGTLHFSAAQVLPCANLIANGAFRRVASSATNTATNTATNAATPDGAAAPANRADSTARDAANIDKAARRKATFDKCKARKDEAGANSGGASLEAFRNCLKEGQP